MSHNSESFSSLASIQIKSLRKKAHLTSYKKLTQANVAKRTGMSLSIYKSIENNKKTITLDEYITIIKFGFKKNPDETLKKILFQK